MNLRWIVETNHFPGPKTLPRIQKHFPESKTLPRIQKHFPESKNTSRIQKTRPRIQKHFPESKTLFEDMVLALRYYKQGVHDVYSTPKMELMYHERIANHIISRYISHISSVTKVVNLVCKNHVLFIVKRFR